MSFHLRTVSYWFGLAAAVILVTIAVLWNAWTFNQYGNVQQQIASISVGPLDTGDVPSAGSPEAAEIELLLEADRRGILDENFEALLSGPQKRALAVSRQNRLAGVADRRKTSLIFGAFLILAAAVAYGAGRAIRNRP